MSGLFENLALTDDSPVIAHRKATAVANKRVKDRFGPFLARGDLSARLALVEDEIVAIVNEVVGEYGGDAAKIASAIRRSYGTMGPVGPPMGTQPMGAQPVGAPPVGQAAGGTTCPQCGSPMVGGRCSNPTCASAAGAGTPGGLGGAPGAPGGAYGMTHSISQQPSSGPIQASYKESRRPKMCPYHSEVVDISLGAGDAQAGFNAMASHAWSDNHCKGGYDGTCNFRPAMVTQRYWDDKQAEYDERREQREQERAQQIPQQIPQELSIDTDPIMHAEPLSDEPGKEGVTDIDGELANAPSAVGAGEMAMAASTHKEAEALKTVDLPTGDDSALGGPSPKIDKGKSGDQGGWSLEPIDTQMDGSPHPSIDQDPTDKADYNKADFLDQTKAVSTTETLPDNSGDAGYDGDRNVRQYPTDTWSGKDGQRNPITRDALSHRTAEKNWIQDAVKRPGQLHKDLDVPEGEKIPESKLEEAEHSDDPKERERAQFAENVKGLGKGKKSTLDPDKNPLRELLEEYDGWLMPNQVEAAVNDWSVG